MKGEMLMQIVKDLKLAFAYGMINFILISLIHENVSKVPPLHILIITNIIIALISIVIEFILIEILKFATKLVFNKSK